METVLPCALHTECASLALTAPLSLSLALLLSAFIWLSQSRSPLSRFLYRTLNSNAGLVSGCTHWQTRTHKHTHTYMHTRTHTLTHTYRLVSILLSLPISIRKRARAFGLSCVLSTVYSLWVMRVFRLSLSKLWFYLACSLSLKENNHFTLKLDSIYILIVQVGLPREQQLKLSQKSIKLFNSNLSKSKFELFLIRFKMFLM